MRKGKLSIFLLTAALVCMLCAVMIATGEDTPGKYSIGAVVRTQEQTEELACWYDDYTGTAYFFLPGYAQLDQVQMMVLEDGMYEIDGIPIEDGMSCEAFALDVLYPLIVSDEADLEAEYIMFVKSEGVSTLFLDVQTGTMDYLHEDKTHDEPADLRIYDASGLLTYSGSVQSVSGRGQSSWREDKKSYNITLQREADLLGMGSAQNWVLQANAKDPSNIRNKIVHDFASAVGLRFSPECQWVDLYLNGEYAGLYLLCERIEIHPQRVDISKSGSFLVVKDGNWRFAEQGEPFVQTREYTALGISYADMSEGELQRIWQSVENAIMAENGVDPDTGSFWLDLIDLESWVKKHLVEEIFGNQDAMMLSQYFYMDGSSVDQRIYAGPIWDYDLTMTGAPNLLYAIRPNNYGTLWPPELYKKEAYYSCLTELYETQFRPLLQQLLDTGIESYVSSVRQASRMNAIRWYFPDAQETAEKILQYMRSRVEFLDGLWIQEKEYVMILAQEEGGIEKYYALEKGAALDMLPEYEDTKYTRYYGWQDVASGELVDLEQPVYADMTVTLQYESIPQPVSDYEEDTYEEPLRLTQLGAAAGFLVALAMLLAANWIRQRRE